MAAKTTKQRTAATQAEHDKLDAVARASQAAPRVRQRRGGPLTERQRKAAQDTFVAIFTEKGNISAAAEAAQVSRETVYQWLEHDTVFAARYQQAEAQSADKLEAEAWRRAVEGVEKPVVSMGKVVYVDGAPLMVREYSDNLLLQMLRARHKRYQQQTDNPQGAGGVTITIRHVADWRNMQSVQVVSEATPPALPEPTE